MHAALVKRPLSRSFCDNDLPILPVVRTSQLTPDSRPRTNRSGMASEYRLRLLGDFSLSAADGVSLVPPSKTLAIVAYLSLSRDRGCTRQALTDLLWPNQSRDRARSSLRQSLFALRKSLGEHVVCGDGEWLELDASVTTDVDGLQSALKRGVVGDAVHAYAGEFIPDEGGVESQPFERWVATERLRLRSAFVAAAHTMYRDLVDRGELSDASLVATRLRDADPDSDDAWHPLFNVLALANRYAEFEIEAATLRAARVTAEADIDAATEALIARLRRQRRGRPGEDAIADEPPAVPVHPEFQGRESLFRDVAAAWARVQLGHGVAMVLEAAPGYGKTRVLQEIGRRMRLERVRVVTCTANHREQDDAYGVLSSLALQLARLPGAAGISSVSARVLARLAPDLAESFGQHPDAVSHEPEELLRLRAHAFVDLCSAVADEAPIVVLIDDLQWADTVSTECLARALEKLADCSLLIVGASRGGVPRLGPGVPLTPLTPEDTSALMGSIAVAEPPGWTPEHTAYLAQVCGGSPFRILQGLRSAIAGGALSVESNRWEVRDWERCAALLDPAISMQDRFAALAEAERRVIASLGALDRPITVAELGEALHLTHEILVESLRRLDREGFVTRRTADGWTLTHALFAEEASEILPRDLRQECAARLGHVIARGVEDTQRLRDAVHLLLSGAELVAALAVVEKFLRTTGYRYDADALVALVAGARADAAFARHIRDLLARQRRERLAGSVLRAALIVFAVAGVAVGFRTWSVGAGQAGSRSVALHPRPPALLPEGLRAYFPLNGDAGNRIAPAASGTPTSVRWVSDRRGIEAAAASFDRAAYIALPPQVINDLPRGSLSLWVLWDGGGGLQAITSKQRDNDNTWAILSINGAAGHGGQPEPGDSGRLYYHGSHEHMTGRANVLRSRTILIPNRWYHVAVTWDLTVVRLYVNGTLETSAECVRCDVTPNVMHDVISRLGDWLPDGRSHRFGGALDEFRLYDRALSPDEVLRLSRE